MKDLIQQIAAPFGWAVIFRGEDYYILAFDNNENQFVLASGPVDNVEPWKVRCVAMATYWFLLASQVPLTAIAIHQDTIKAMLSEEFKTEPEEIELIPQGASAFRFDPDSPQNYMGAVRKQVAPPANPTSVTQGGKYEIVPGASPRRRVADEGRLNW
jgi:hypothetical protein